jgi:eukaryotic-like serine/threonine-protein kinase
VEGLAALFAGLLTTLRGLVSPDACLGAWPWAVTALGVVVGLMPAAGALAVALLRRRIGSQYGFGESAVLVGAGVLTAGLLPLAAFTSTGEVFSSVARGAPIAGLGPAAVKELGTRTCIGGTQAKYLGAGSVSAAFDIDQPLQFGAAVFLLVLLPLLVAAFVWGQARLVLRRGPSWPTKFFWVPMLALVVLTSGVPRGTAAHLWIGAAPGAFLGIFVALLAGAPSRAAIRRASAPPPAQAPRPEPRPRQQERPSARQAAAATPPIARRPAPPPMPSRVAPTPAPKPAPAPVGGAARFELIRRLGAGGFGRVWLAHDARLGKVVALKAAHAPDSETEERIRREAQALAAVRHPNCVRIYDLIPARSDPGLVELDGMVIVMGYVDGVSLGDLVRTRGLLDDVAAARIWMNLAGALDAAHQQGVKHRDVKPGNVVVDGNGAAHLIDFGIARKSGDSTMTQAGFVLGTPDYLAPEVACGERATPASDAWQLAATISFALSGHPPRGGHDDAISGLRAAASGAPLSHLPKRTAHLALLQAAMDNDPNRRPALRVVQSALGDWLRRSGAHQSPSVPASAP